MNRAASLDLLDELFEGPAEGSAAARKRFRIITRRGEVLLALPMHAQEFSAGCALYPAQRRLGRWLGKSLRILAQSRLPSPLRCTEYSVNANSAFGKFLSGVAPGWTDLESGVAVLAGNPETSGRRFILLLFQYHTPFAVVKAGASPEARKLIRREASFLSVAHGHGIEPPVVTFESEDVSAFAMSYIEGGSPEGEMELGKILTSWIRSDAKVAVEEIPAWVRLKGACGLLERFSRTQSLVGGRQVATVLSHGDFAPWNVKVHPASGAWQVLDWERGEMIGVPGWDWLHFKIQTAILVHRNSAEVILKCLDLLFESTAFHMYAEKTGITGIERPLTVCYLLYCNAVQRQSEGAAQIEALLEQARIQWSV